MALIGELYQISNFWHHLGFHHHGGYHLYIFYSLFGEGHFRGNLVLHLSIFFAAITLQSHNYHDEPDSIHTVYPSLLQLFILLVLCMLAAMGAVFFEH